MSKTRTNVQLPRSTGTSRKARARKWQRYFHVSRPVIPNPAAITEMIVSPYKGKTLDFHSNKRKEMERELKAPRKAMLRLFNRLEAADSALAHAPR